MVDIIIAVAILAVFCGGLFYISYRGFKKARVNKRAVAAVEKRLGATMHGTLKHISGLPLANGLMVEVFYGPEKITFKKDGQEITISRNKVTGIDVVTGNGSARKAIGGAATGKYVVGGATGAAIGALAAIDTYLVISYTSDGKNKSIKLDTAASGSFATKVAKDFKQTSKAKRSTIEL